jgi:hypothetical protein
MKFSWGSSTTNCCHNKLPMDGLLVAMVDSLWLVSTILDVFSYKNVQFLFPLSEKLIQT